MSVEGPQLYNEVAEPGEEGGQLEPLSEASSPEGAQREQQVPGAGKPGWGREGSPGRRTGRAALGFQTVRLRKRVAGEVPETGLSLQICPESAERLAEQEADKVPNSYLFPNGREIGESDVGSAE